MPHYHLSVLAAGMVMASARFSNERAARSCALSLFSRLPHRRLAGLERRLASSRFALLPPAYVIVIEDCEAEACLPHHRNRR